MPQHRSPNASSGPAPNPAPTDNASYKTTNLPRATPPRRAPNRAKPQIYPRQPLATRREERGRGETHRKISREKTRAPMGRIRIGRGRSSTAPIWPERRPKKNSHGKNSRGKAKAPYLPQAAKTRGWGRREGEREGDASSLFFLSCGPAPPALACRVGDLWCACETGFQSGSVPAAFIVCPMCLRGVGRGAERSTYVGLDQRLSEEESAWSGKQLVVFLFTQ
jgi:hypothetical protein